MKRRYQKTKRDWKRLKKIATVPQVRRMIASKIEMKHIDVITDRTVSATGSTQSISQIAAGPGINERIGKSVIVKRIEFRFSMNLSDTYNHMRIILFNWNVDDLVDVPDPGQIFTNTGTQNGVYSPLIYKSSNFKVYRDIHQSVDDIKNQTTWYYMIKNFKRGHKINYNDTASQAGYSKLNLAFISDSLVGPDPQIVGTTRVFYQDG